MNPVRAYSAHFLVSIERTVTKERVTRYLRATRQDVHQALHLYEYNVQLSEVVYGLLHGIEMMIRNARAPRAKRISHHEPVLTSSERLYAGHDFITLPELLECVEWVCADTAEWMKTHFRYSEAERILFQVKATGLSL